MGWQLNCSGASCGGQPFAANIVDLIANHRDSDGWFRCKCGAGAHIEKSFDLQEPGETWQPFLRGIITLGTTGNTYQPFVFLVSYEATGPVTDVWFSYYKDLRSTGGKLKLGYGPGGPPVLGKGSVLNLIERLRSLDVLSEDDLAAVVSK